jgi:type I restriction enzyme, S subunit
MASDWPHRPLGKLTENFDSIRVPVKEADRRTGPYSYYGASGIVGHVDSYLFDGEYLLIAEDGENLRTRNTPIAFMACGKFWVNNHAHIVKGNPDADTRFLMYALANTDISGYLTGSTLPKLTQGNLNRILVPAPLVTEQKAVASVLGTLDDKIELNRQVAETLESIARALFTSWFVDFAPVRAKAEGHDPGLLSQLSDLFPSSFENSELGQIPTGWSVGKFGEVAENPRRGVSPDEIQPTTHYIALEHMPRKCIALSDWGTAAGIESGKFVFHAGEILFGKLRPYFHKVVVAPVDGVCSTDILVVVPRSEVWLGFVLGHVSSATFVEHTNAGSTGTKMPRTNWGEMARYPLVLPPEPIAKAFAELIRPMISRILISIHQNRTLASLRDTLLPRLISGEIRLPDPERIVGRQV